MKEDTKPLSSAVFVCVGQAASGLFLLCLGVRAEALEPLKAFIARVATPLLYRAAFFFVLQYPFFLLVSHATA